MLTINANVTSGGIGANGTGINTSTFGGTGATLTLSCPVVLGNSQTWNVGNATSGNVTVSSVISGAHSITKTGAGTLTLSNASNTYSGTTVNGGLLVFNADGSLGTAPGSPTTNITLNNGEIKNNDTTISLNANRNVSITNTGYIDVGWNLTMTVSGQISGGGNLGLAFDGGTLLLNGSDSYLGNTLLGTTAGPS